MLLPVTFDSPCLCHGVGGTGELSYLLVGFWDLDNKQDESTARHTEAFSMGRAGMVVLPFISEVAGRNGALHFQKNPTYRLQFVFRGP